jgi:hypothetical protein
MSQLLAPDPVASTEDGPHLVADRQCGACDVCCRIYEIDAPGVKKEPGVLCPHHTGKGCGIYATRPGMCRDFFCLWRRVERFSDALRPDRCRVLFRSIRIEEPRIIFESYSIIAQAITPDPAVFEHEPVKGALELLAQEGRVPIWTSLCGVKSLFYPDFPFMDAILRPVETPWQTLVPRAFAWLQQYEMILATLT